MGFSTAAVTAILFSACIVFFITVYQVVYNNFSDQSEVWERANARDYALRNTELEIIEISYDKFENNLSVIVENEGEITLNPKYLTWLLNGSVINGTYIDIVIEGVETEIWLPDELLHANITNAQLYYVADIEHRLYRQLTTNLELACNLTTSWKYIYVIDAQAEIEFYTPAGVFVKTLRSLELSAPTDIVASANYLFVVNATNSIYRLDLEGNNLLEILPDESGKIPTAIAANTNYVYFVNNTNSVFRLTFDGTELIELIPATAGYQPTDLYVDDYYIYIINNYESVVRFELDGSNAILLIPAGGSFGELEMPIALSVSDYDFYSRFIYIIDAQSHIEVYDIDGGYHSTITSAGIGNQLNNIDCQAKLFLADDELGLSILNLGTPLKVVTEHGYSYHTLI